MEQVVFVLMIVLFGTFRWSVLCVNKNASLKYVVQLSLNVYRDLSLKGGKLCFPEHLFHPDVKYRLVLHQLQSISHLLHCLLGSIGKSIGGGDDT